MNIQQLLKVVITLDLGYERAKEIQFFTDERVSMTNIYCGRD